MYISISISISISLSLSIHVYLYLSIYLSIFLSIYIYTYIPIYLYISIYLSIYLLFYLSIYASMYLCISVSMYLCIYVSMYLCIYVSMYLCICVSMYLYIYGEREAGVRALPPEHLPQPRLRAVLVWGSGFRVQGLAGPPDAAFSSHATWDDNGSNAPSEGPRCSAMLGARPFNRGSPVVVEGGECGGRRVSASERRGSRLKGFKDFYLKAKAKIWPCLTYMCHIRSTADTHTPYVYFSSEQRGRTPTDTPLPAWSFFPWQQ